LSEYDDVDLIDIKKRKMLELRKKILEDQQEEERRKEIEARKQAMLRVILTSEARARLNNLRLIKPELTEQIETQLIQLVQSGKLRPPITDDLLKQMLIRLDGWRREIRIKRI
jgi:programmed cell death protein 5